MQKQSQKFVIQGVQKCQSQRLNRKKWLKIKKKSSSNQLAQKTKKLRHIKLITHDFFLLQFTSKNLEIFMESRTEVS